MLLIKANQNVIDPLILFGEGDLHKSGRYYFVKIHRLTNIKLIFKKMKKNILFWGFTLKSILTRKGQSLYVLQVVQIIVNWGLKWSPV